VLGAEWRALVKLGSHLERKYKDLLGDDEYRSHIRGSPHDPTYLEIFTTILGRMKRKRRKEIKRGALNDRCHLSDAFSGRDRQ
jgi:hypothetical protein